MERSAGSKGNRGADGDSHAPWVCVDRQEAEGDRRQKVVALTPLGVSHIENFRATAAKAYARLVANVPPDRREGSASTLVEIVASLPPAPGANEAPPASGEKHRRK